MRYNDNASRSQELDRGRYTVNRMDQKFCMGFNPQTQVNSNHLFQFDLGLIQRRIALAPATEPNFTRRPVIAVAACELCGYCSASDAMTRPSVVPEERQSANA